MATTRKPIRWRQLTCFTIRIDMSVAGNCWRVRTTSNVSPPVPMEQTGVPVEVKFGGERYVGVVRIERTPEGPDANYVRDMQDENQREEEMKIARERGSAYE